MSSLFSVSGSCLPRPPTFPSPHRRVHPGLSHLIAMLGLGTRSRTLFVSSSRFPPIIALSQRSYVSLSRSQAAQCQWHRSSAISTRRFLTTPSQPRQNESSTVEKKDQPPTPKRSFWSRILPTSFAADTTKSASSFRKIVALAKPEKKPLGIAIGLLLVSSSVSMSIPFTIGKLIDYFTTANPVRHPLACMGLSN